MREIRDYINDIIEEFNYLLQKTEGMSFEEFTNNKGV